MVDFAEFKRFFLFNMIGSLILCAAIAVISILVGSFGEVTRKSLTTLFMIVIHSLIALAFIWDNEKQGTFNRLSFFINVIFVIIVLSFITSIFGVWDILPGIHVWHCYLTYFVFAFAALHADILSKAFHLQDYLDGIIYLNYIIMVGVVGMLIPVIFIENAGSVLDPFYFRFLGALGVVDGTLSILTIIFYKLHMIKHPRTNNTLGYVPAEVVNQGQNLESPTVKKKGLSVWVWILIIYLFFQIFGALMGGLFFGRFF